MEDLCRVTGYSSEHIRRLVRHGKLDAVKPGRRFIFAQDSVQQWLEDLGFDVAWIDPCSI